MDYYKKEKDLINKLNDLNELDRNNMKIIFHNIVDFDYDEVETELEIIPTITDKLTNKTCNLFDFIKDKSNIIDTSHYMSGIRRKR